MHGFDIVIVKYVQYQRFELDRESDGSERVRSLYDPGGGENRLRQVCRKRYDDDIDE
jgi:hypothetical protein